MVQTQKQRLEEAYEINSRFHNYMGFLVCDGEEDMLALRKLYKKIQREAVKNHKWRVGSSNGILKDKKIVKDTLNIWCEDCNIKIKAKYSSDLV